MTVPLIAFIGTALEYAYFKLGSKAGGQVLCSSEAYLIVPAWQRLLKSSR